MKTILKKAILPIVAMVAFVNFASAQTLNTVVTESIGNPPAVSLYQYGTQGIVVNITDGYTTDYMAYAYNTPSFGTELPGSIRGGGLCELNIPYKTVILPLDTYKVKLYKRGQYGIEWSITLTVVK